LQVGDKPRLKVPQAGRERAMRREERQRAVFDKAWLDARREVIRQQLCENALERRDLFDARAQSGERVSAAKHLGNRLRPPRRGRKGGSRKTAHVS
jgi:hypothetical protein